jgi:hypothetical protein
MSSISASEGRRTIREILCIIEGPEPDTIKLKDKIIELAYCFYTEKADTEINNWVPNEPDIDHGTCDSSVCVVLQVNDAK